MGRQTYPTTWAFTPTLGWKALAMAINNFPGGVVLVSHDERLLQMMADEIWVVNKGEIHEDGTVTPGTVTIFEA